jgi:hypothetical protein
VLSTAKTLQGTTFVQISRLGSPLVNEAVIGLPDKDEFNASYPQNDADFLTYVTNPTLPVLLNVLFGTARGLAVGCSRITSASRHNRRQGVAPPFRAGRSSAMHEIGTPCATAAR